MDKNIVLAVIFGAAAVVGAMETVYQIYRLTVMDAARPVDKNIQNYGDCLLRTGIIRVGCYYI